MATEVFMPKAGMDMQEGRLIRWLKNVGDPVELNEPIMEIETDKITMEAESPASGYLIAQLVGEDTVVPVLQTIGYVGEKDETPPEASAPVSATAAAPVEAAQPAQAAQPATATKLASGDGAVAATPYAKTLAKQNGIDLSAVAPSGKHGEVTGADVEQSDVNATPLARRIANESGMALSGIQGTGHAGKITKDDLFAVTMASPAGQLDDGEDIHTPLSAMRRVISERMTRSHQEVPVVTQHMKVNVTRLLELREQINAGREREQKISVNDFMIKIVAQAVREHPLARTFFDGTEYITKPEVNIGFAVGMDEGLLVPVVKYADLMPLSAISEIAKDLAVRARSGGLKPDDMSGGVFTISNMGMFDVFAFTPIINQPEPGILGICAVQDELALEGGELVVNKVMMISLTYDHRILDGVTSVKFQLRVKELIENPLEVLV